MLKSFKYKIRKYKISTKWINKVRVHWRKESLGMFAFPDSASDICVFSHSPQQRPYWFQHNRNQCASVKQQLWTQHEVFMSRNCLSYRWNNESAAAASPLTVQSEPEPTVVSKQPLQHDWKQLLLQESSWCFSSCCFTRYQSSVTAEWEVESSSDTRLIR